jgi:hypothetical protein
MQQYFLPAECENRESKLCPHRVSNTPDKQLIASYQSEIAGLYQ